MQIVVAGCQAIESRCELGYTGLRGHTKLESTVRYLGVEGDDALEISEQTEI